MSEPERARRGFDVLDRWIQPRVGAAQMGAGARIDRVGGYEWVLEFGSGTKYLLVRDEVLADPYLMRMATLRLERVGWLDEPGTEELTIDATWARRGPGQLRWAHPGTGTTYVVTFWGDALRDRDRVTFAPLDREGADAEPATFDVPDESRPTEPPQGDIRLTEKLMAIRGEPMPEPPDDPGSDRAGPDEAGTDEPGADAATGDGGEISADGHQMS